MRSRLSLDGGWQKPKFFIFMSDISTGDLNPVYNVPMLGAHKSRNATSDKVSCLILARHHRRIHSNVLPKKQCLKISHG